MNSKALVYHLLKAALFIVATGTLLQGCKYFDEISVKREVDAARQAATGELQKKRALIVSEASLQNLDRIDIAVSLPKDELLRFKEIVLTTLQSDQTLKKAGISVDSVDFDLDDQEILFTIQIQMVVGPANVKARIKASGIVGALESGLMFNLVAREIFLDKIELAKDAKDIPAIASAINKALDSTLGLVNAAIDIEINRNPHNAIVVWLDQRGLIDIDTNKSNTETLTFVPKGIKTAMIAKSTAVIVDKKHIVVLVKADFGDPDTFPETLPDIPFVGDLVVIDKDEAVNRVATYQKSVRTRLEAAFGADFANSTVPTIAFARNAAARALNHALSQTPVEATAFLREREKASTDLTVKIDEQNCQDLINGCEFKDVCADESVCHKKDVQTVEDLVCKAACSSLPNVGIGGVNPRGRCEEACGTVQKIVITPIVNAHCDAFRALGNPTGVCTIASNVDKASCDIQKNLNKSVCDIQQEVRRFYEHNAFATVESDVKPDVAITIRLQQASVSDELANLQLKAEISGKGSVDAGLKYVRRVPSDALIFTNVGFGVCTTNWAEHANIEVSTSSAVYDLQFVSQIEADETKGEIKLRYELQNEQIIKLNFSPSPMQAFFGEKPHLAINCPAAVIGASIIGTGEAIFTREDARKVMPLFTGENYPYKVSKANFNLVIPKLKVCRSIDKTKCETDQMTLAPHAVGGAIIFMPWESPEK